RVIGLLRDVVAEFGVDKTSQLETVDLGGGLGISYLPQDDPPPVEDLAAKLGAIVRNESAAVGLPAPRLVVEPGRAIAGPGDITPGDLLGVAATGAYCYSMSSRYNLIGRPAVVAVRNGQARLILRRETVDDLLSLEVTK